MLFISMSLFSQHTITGTVTDENSDLLIGVSVVVKETATGVTTDFDGKYSITVQNDKSILEFSYIGMKTKEVEVGTSNVIDVVLSEDGATLSEVVVVGYGRNRLNLRGRVAGISINRNKKSNSKPLSTPEPNAESYARINENAFKTVKREPLSTFLIDVESIL